MKMKYRLFFILIIFFSAFIAQTSASLSPAEIMLNSSSGVQKINFNFEGSQGNYIIFAQGELNSSLSFQENSFSLSSSAKTIECTFSPEGASPGVHEADVVLMNLNSGEQYSARILVSYPYPEKYVNATLQVNNVLEGSETGFVVNLNNMGIENVSDASANIEIFNSLGTKVAELKTNHASVSSGESVEIRAPWKADFPVGEYKAVADIEYDGNSISEERSFNIGNMTLDLQQAIVREFALGGIAKFELLTQNLWDRNISGVTSDIKITDSSGNSIAEFKSTPYDISPLEKADIVSFWDTSNLNAGNYSANVHITGSGMDITKVLSVDVSDNSIGIFGLSEIQQNSNTSSGPNLTLILVIIALILVSANIGWFVFIRKRLFRRR